MGIGIFGRVLIQGGGSVFQDLYVSASLFCLSSWLCSYLRDILKGLYFYIID